MYIVCSTWFVCIGAYARRRKQQLTTIILFYTYNIILYNYI